MAGMNVTIVCKPINHIGGVVVSSLASYAGVQGVRFPDPPTLEKCAKGICLCNLFRSTQPNDRETVIEG